MPYGHASMLLLAEGSEATEPYIKYDKIRPHSYRSLQFDQKVQPLSFRQEKFDLITATRLKFKSLPSLKLSNKPITTIRLSAFSMKTSLFPDSGQVVRHSRTEGESTSEATSKTFSHPIEGHWLEQ